MSEEPKNSPDTGAEEKPQWTPASPTKRLWAWVGIVYMVGLVLLTTYGLAHGSFITGIGPLMLAPALAGIGGTAILRYRAGLWRGGPVTCGLVAGAAFVLSLLNLIRGIPILLAQL